MIMASLDELTSMRARLFDARMSGIREVQDQNGERIVYRSDSEMARAMAALDAEIAGVASKPASTIHFKTSKGLK